MRKIWLALFAAVPLLLGGEGAASAQMHGGGGGWRGGGGGWHGEHFHDGRFFHGGRFNNFHTNFRVFIGAPAFWWGAPYYPYYYPYSYYGGSYATPVYGDPGSATYMQQYGGARAQSSGEYWYYCTDPAGYYPQVRNCAQGWLKVVPDGSPMP
jgi:hypothetical protein